MNAPRAAGQGTGDVDLAADTLTVPTELILGKENRIAASVRNNGQVPATARVILEIQSNALPGPYKPLDEDNVALRPGATETFGVDWDGTVDGAPLRENFVIRLEVRPGSSSPFADTRTQNNVLNVTRSLRIYDLAITSSAAVPSTIAPDGTSSAVVTVRNRGNVEDTVGLALTDPTPGWDFSLSDALVEIPPHGSSLAVELTAKAPTGAMAGEQANVTVTARSVPAPHVMASIVAQGPVVGRAGSLKLVGPAAPLDATPGQPERFDATLDNNQNTADEIRLELLTTEPSTTWDWTVDPNPADVAPRGRVVFSVDLQVPDDAPSGAHTWTLRAQSLDPDGPTATAPLAVNVRQIHRIEAALQTPPSSVPPLTDTPFRIRVNNTGNGPEHVYARLDPLPAEWTATAPEQQLSAGNEATLEIVVRAPGTAPSGTRTLRFVTFSQAQPTSQIPVFTAVDIPPVVIPDLAADKTRTPIAEAEEVSIALTVANVGNVDGNLLLQTSVLPGSSPTQGWSVTLAPASFQAGPGIGATNTATLKVTGPPQLTSSDKLLLKVTLQSDQQPARTDEIAITFAPAMPDLELTILGTTPDPVYRDQPAQLSFRLNNSGTFDAEGVVIRAASRAADTSAVLDEEEFTIEHLGWEPDKNSTTINMNVSTNAHTLVIELTADPADALDELNEDNNQATLTLDTRVFAFAVLNPADVTADPGAAVAFTGGRAFQIRNEGEEDEVVLLSAHANPSWMTPITDLRITVPAGKTHILPLNALVPQEPDAEQCRVSVEIRHPTNPDLTEAAVTLIRTRDEVPPNITDMGANASTIPVGESASFSANIRDALGIEQAKLFIVSPTGAVKTVPMTGQGLSYAAQARFDEPGAHAFHVWARDASSRHNQADTQATQGTLRVIAANRPVLSLLSPAPDEILRRGEIVNVAVTGGAAITAAHYHLDNQSVVLRPAEILEIDTRGWRGGPTQLTVHVTDDTGLDAEAGFPLSVDAAPPTLRNLTIFPASAKDGETIQARVIAEDDTGIAVATLLVFRGDKPGSAAPMTQNGSQYWADFVFRSDMTKLVVVAEDAAGNKGHADREFIPAAAAQEIHGSPSPSILLSLAVVATTFAVIRKRRDP